jgi:hypothetical protein
LEQPNHLQPSIYNSNLRGSGSIQKSGLLSATVFLNEVQLKLKEKNCKASENFMKGVSKEALLNG